MKCTPGKAFDLALPDGVRVSDLTGSQTLDHAALAPLVTAVAARLGELGVGPGVVILYQGPQQAAALVLFWASMIVGGVFVPVDEGWPAFQLAHAAGRLAPGLVVTTSAAAAAVFPDAASLHLDGGTDFGGLSALADWAAGTEGTGATAIVPATAAGACLYTSGSSGTPKAVVLSRAALIQSARSTIDAFGWEPGERLVNLPDPHTMSGLRNAFLAAPLGGVEWVPLPGPDRGDLFSLIEKLALARCQRLVIGPLLLRQLALLGARVPAAMFDGLKAIYCTGAPLDATSAARMHARWGVPVINYYGLTETAGLCLSQRLSGWRPGDVGLGHPVDCQARLVGADGVISSTDVEGELQIRSARLMSGYLGDAQASAERFDGDWLRTGDLARRRADGSYELVGRIGHFINTLATERIQPEEIEQVLERHDEVVEAAVFGRPEPGGGERIIALVVPAPVADAARDLTPMLAEFAAEHLGLGRRPSLILLVESLPRQNNGKLLRHRLPELAQ
ncbi:acyl-coenzyme A synthetase/AMP-(fatty) acid ligase [Caulobacter ginsengisoli]|uniref:Acyl-coenzyme A synthetase/AMP-(Fatty) acid ligase n=1 Tax=Caulobacter ginsengisoli TaxID=400775 RepID=A0ABU0IUR3_9CAUL|nr:class I adenylate-forming enzyme family protein [Caulobacter ginsengisoli]MDQ0465756.1 acyl-coenzyme A synthetase/AMP-(fatty) acid ligase [Caulobacter ginsengisoli]